MFPVESSDILKSVHSEIRGPVYERAMQMRAAGETVLRLNTGNPATFGFTMPESVCKALMENADRAVAYCDPRGMPEAREALLAYHRARGIENLNADEIFLGNGISELAPMLCSSILSAGEEILMPSPCYSLWSNAALLAGGKPVFTAAMRPQDGRPIRTTC